MRSVKTKNSLYHLTFMVALTASLLLVTLCFNVPFQFNASSEDWQPYTGSTGSGSEPNHYILHVPASYAQATSPSDNHSSELPLPMTQKTLADSTHESYLSLISAPQTVPILDYAEVMPEIHGGLRSYYILINYPEEAIHLGIEGKLSLTFTVNQNGSVSNIIVSEPLHALLDSAAVQALRRTRFIPGQHLGRSARVRMKLPVRFELINPVDSTLTESLTSEEAS